MPEIPIMNSYTVSSKCLPKLILRLGTNFAENKELFLVYTTKARCLQSQGKNMIDMCPLAKNIPQRQRHIFVEKLHI